MRRLPYGWFVVATLVLMTGCGDDDGVSQPVDFTLSVVPTEITDSVPRQRCVFLVTVANAGGAAAEAVTITGAAPGADVTVEHEALLPGEVAEIPITLQPISVVIPKGHRVRVAIAGHDAALKDRFPASGTPKLSFQRNAVYPAGIKLPAMSAPGS